MKTRKDIVLGRACAFGAALAYGGGMVLTRRGVGTLASPLVGATISLVAGTLVMSLITIRGIKASNITRVSLKQNSRAIIFLLISGVAASLGVVASFFALSLTPVVVVSPILNTGLLFTFAWSHFFLAHRERITLKLIAGAILVVAGVILITIGQAALSR